MNKDTLSACEICEVIELYAKEDIYQYAIMLDGEWGCGKSYLIDHGVAPMFEKGGALAGKKYIYISLYGVSSLEELGTLVSNGYLSSVLGKKGSLVIDLATTLGQTWLKTIKDYGEAISDTVKKIQDGAEKKLIQLKDCFFVFDDLERCCIPTVEVLGYINRLIEHNLCKVLIIANEKECGHAVKQAEELRLISAAMLVECGQDNSDKKDIKTIQSLKRDLFEKENMYFRTKEKLIGKTLRYDTDVEEIVPAIVCKVLGSLIENHVEIEDVSNVCIEVLKGEKTKNMRILQYALSAFSQVFNVIQDIEMEESERKRVLSAVMNAILRVAIRFKKDENIDESLFYWEEKTAYGNVHCKEQPEFNDKNAYYEWMKSHFFSFRFIHQYVLTGKMDIEMVKKDLTAYARLLKSERELEEDVYTKLNRGYWYFTEEELKSALEQMEIKFLRNGYEEGLCLRVISTSLQYWNMFQIGDPDRLCEYLVESVESGKISIDLEYEALDHLLEGEARKRYKQCLDQIEYIRRKEGEEADRAYFSCFSGECWSEVYKHTDHNRELLANLIAKEKFASLIDIPRLVHAIEEGSSADTVNVLNAFNWVYEGNWHYFLNDLASIKEIIRGVEGIGTEDCVKRRVLNRFIEKLKEIKEEILEIRNTR